jgi:hypothetical protein
VVICSGADKGVYVRGYLCLLEKGRTGSIRHRTKLGGHAPNDVCTWLVWWMQSPDLACLPQKGDVWSFFTTLATEAR